MPTPKPAPPKLLSSCHCCADEYSWSLDELFWSATIGDYLCENCWDKQDHGEPGVSALEFLQRAPSPANAALPAKFPKPQTPLPWFHRHPCGGNEIYPDGATREPLAHFNNEPDCDYAIACANLMPAALAQRDALLSALQGLLDAVSLGEIKKDREGHECSAIIAARDAIRAAEATK